MEPVADKVLAGNRFWPALSQKLSDNDISLPAYYKLIKREPVASYKSYNAPKISEMPAIFDYIKSTPAQIFSEIGREDYLTKEARDVLETFSHLDEKTISGLTYAAYLSVGAWIYEGPRYNPAYRLLQYVDRHIIPQSVEDFTVYNLKRKYRKVLKSQVEQDEIPEWLVGNSKRLPISTNNFDIEEWLDTAKYLGVSMRWLYSYDIKATFYGYRPDVETLYDIYTLATKDMQIALYESAKAKEGNSHA